MDLEKIKNTFLRYVEDNFNLSNSNIKRKYMHSQVVARYAVEIAKSINLREEDQDLAYVIGILHDFGRFSQWKKYGTYKDIESVDHAQFGAKILFEENKIAMFDIPKKYYETIRTSIEQHNKFEIDKDIKNNEILTQCKIIRDADKSNRYEMNFNKELNVSTMKNGISIEVLGDIYSEIPVNFKYVNTKLDRILFDIASTYDLNYSISIEKLIEMGYFEKMIERFAKILNEQDKKELEKCCNIIKNNLIRAIKCKKIEEDIKTIYCIPRVNNLSSFWFDLMNIKPIELREKICRYSDKLTFAIWDERSGKHSRFHFHALVNDEKVASIFLDNYEIDFLNSDIKKNDKKDIIKWLTNNEEQLKQICQNNDGSFNIPFNSWKM